MFRGLFYINNSASTAAISPLFDLLSHNTTPNHSPTASPVKGQSCSAVAHYLKPCLLYTAIVFLF